jgi:hypothetical protein
MNESDLLILSNDENLYIFLWMNLTIIFDFLVFCCCMVAQQSQTVKSKPPLQTFSILYQNWYSVIQQPS